MPINTNVWLHISLYAAFLCAGSLIFYRNSQKTLMHWGYSKKTVFMLLGPAVLLGWIVSRAVYCLASGSMRIFLLFWNGGFSPSALMAAVFLWIAGYCHFHKISFQRILDGTASNSFWILAGWQTGLFSLTNRFIDLAAAALFVCLWFLFAFGIREKIWRRSGDLLWIFCLVFGFYCLIGFLYLNFIPFDGWTGMVWILAGIGGLLKKSNPKKPAVLFDLDGTLVNTQPLVFATFREVFRKLKPDYTLSQEELYSFFGPTLEATFIKYFPEDQIEDVIELYQQINLSLHDEMLQPIKNAQRTLAKLKEENYKVGIVSNKRKKVVLRGLEKAGLLPYVDLVMGKEDLGRPKPCADGLIAAANSLNTGYDEVVYVGDNRADIEAAKNMGAYSIGFSIDPVQMEALKQAAPMKLISDLGEIPQILQEETEWIDKSIW